MSGAPSNDDPPRLWELSGQAARDTRFDLRVFGRPNAKALRNIILIIETTAKMIEEDDALAESTRDGAPPKTCCPLCKLSPGGVCHNLPDCPLAGNPNPVDHG